MARLPQPGSDTGTWGQVLNDFLSVEHAPDGTLKNQPLNVKNFGAKGDGVTDDTAAIQNAINAAKATNGATIFFPRSTKAYICAGTLTIHDSLNIRLVGETGVSGFQTGLVYTGSGTDNFLSIRDSHGFELLNLSVMWNNSSYTGDFISADWGEKRRDPAYIRIENCYFNGDLARSIIRFNQTIISTIRNCTFVGGDVAIRVGDGGYANVIQIENCTFMRQISKQIYGISNQSVSITGCTFEPLKNGNAGAIYQSPDSWSWATTITGCWFGDVGASPGTWIELHARGALISGNFMYSPGPTPTDTHIKLNKSEGVCIQANTLWGGTGIDFGTDYSRGVFIYGNDFQTQTHILNNNKNLNGAFMGNDSVANSVNQLEISGGNLYVERGALKYKSPNGTITTLGPA